MKNVLIASSRIDAGHTSPVADSLKRRGYHVVVYEADEVYQGRASFALAGPESATPLLRYEKNVYRMDEFGAAWLRRPKLIDMQPADILQMVLLREEIGSLQKNIWAFVPGPAWLNPPAKAISATSKLLQLSAATGVGFTTPATVMTTDWSDVRELMQDGGRVVMKMHRGALVSNGKAISFPTRVLTRSQVDELETLGVRPFPGLFQPYLTKAREWRITVVGDQCFDAAIYTDENAKDDWRRHYDTPGVRFKRESIREDIHQKCFALLETLGLRFGAFDFIEADDGAITFLEVNPNGQYMWLELGLGLPISEAIAEVLHGIATGAQQPTGPVRDV